MRLSQSNIQTLREAPSNARTEGFAWLVRAGYLTRDSEVTPLGQRAISRIQERVKVESEPADLFNQLEMPVIATEEGHFFYAISTGKQKVLQCPKCNYAARQDLARFTKETPEQEAALPLEKVYTPNCYTIEALAEFLEIPTEKTAKAILLTRKSDGKFVFVVVRGDMQLSEAKLMEHVDDFRAAEYVEITAAGASPGFASPIGLEDALILVDDLVPLSPNLVAGANEDEYHMLNVNYDRDYSAEIIADLVEANAGDACPNCDGVLKLHKTDLVGEVSEGKFAIHPFELLQALAQTHHDDNGLAFPKFAAPLDVYLLAIPGKNLDTKSVADEMYENLQKSGLSVLYDDRDTRAGVKFNDADLIGPPLRVTVGERSLESGNVEIKARTAQEKQLISVEEISKFLHENL